VLPDLKTVIELQQTDTAIGELTSRIEALPSEVQALEADLDQFIHAHEERKQRQAANQKERREFELEVQTVQEKISRHKDQLYQVKTNEQYRAMLKEIGGEESNIRKIEDRILERMIEAEELQKKVQEAAAHLESEKARVAAEKTRLESARQTAAEERDRLLARRKELEVALSDDVRELYERVRKARRGLALAEVRDGFCSACNVRLRPQAYNEARTNESILTCENCLRILYFIEPPLAAGDRPEDESARAASSV